MADRTDTPPVRHPSRAAEPAAAVDPRVARSRAAVLRTATDLLVEGGPGAVTIDAIVARSGVARSTIYRHWDSRDDVLVAVIERCAPHLEAPDASTAFEASLEQLVDGIAALLNDPDWARVLPALLALRNQDHGVAQLEQRLEARQERAVETVLERGVAEGRLAPDIDVDQAAALLVGPLLYASLMGKPVIDAAFVRHVVDAFLNAHAADPA